MEKYSFTDQNKGKNSWKSTVGETMSRHTERNKTQKGHKYIWKYQIFIKSVNAVVYSANKNSLCSSPFCRFIFRDKNGLNGVFICTICYFFRSFVFHMKFNMMYDACIHIHFVCVYFLCDWLNMKLNNADKCSLFFLPLDVPPSTFEYPTLE